MDEIRINVPENVCAVLDRLTQAGYEAFVVGGCVRDSLLGRQPNDWDVTTSARPRQVKKLFRRTVDTGIKHGTVTVLTGGAGVEVTTYRIDGSYSDGRHPDSVTFTVNLIGDLERRDFTINALAYHPQAGLVDAFDGIGDLRRHVVRCVGDPDRRFGEDALRILRAVRFAAQLNFSIEEETREAVRRAAPNLHSVSAERIRTEFVKTIDSDHPECFDEARKLGITACFLPEYDAMCASDPEAAGRAAHQMRQVRPETPLRAAVLFAGFGRDVQESAQMADRILRRLKSDNDTREKTMRLIACSQMAYTLEEKDIRRALHDAGEDIFPDLIAVQTAQTDDPDRKAFYSRVLEKARAVQAEGQCFRLSDLAVGGRDLIAAGVRPGPEIGKILDAMLDAVIEDPSLNNKDILIEQLPQFRHLS